MTIQSLRHISMVGITTVLATAAFAQQAYAQGGPRGPQSAEKTLAGANQKSRTTIRPMVTFADHTALLGGGSILMRTKDGVYMSLNAFGLPSGSAATAWFVIFNDPEKCATRPCSVADIPTADVQASLVNATGRIVGSDGSATFGAFKAVGDTTGAFLGPGLLNPFTAEIHLAVRLHGSAIVDNPQTLTEQLTLFNGGCPPNTCGNVQVSIHEP